MTSSITSDIKDDDKIPGANSQDVDSTAVAVYDNETNWEHRVHKIRKILRPVSVLVFSGAQILDILNVTGLIFSTQNIAGRYDIPFNEASWTISAYSLTYGSFILMAGRLADYVGHRFTFTIGMCLVAVCCLVCAASKDPYVLFVFRALQGVGASLTIPTSFALVAHSFTGRTQALAFAMVGSAAAMGGIVGVLVGGAFAQTTLGYHGLLYLSFALACAFSVLPYFTVEETPTSKEKLKLLDWVGSVIIVCGVILIVFGFTSAPGKWKSARVIAPLIIGALLIVLFAYYETYVANQKFGFEPLLPRYVWKFKNLAPIFVMAPLETANLFVVLFAGSNELIAEGFTPIHAGVNFIALGIVFALACVVGGATFGKFSPKYFLTISPLLNIIGAVLMVHIEYKSYWRFMFPATIFMAIGTGFFISTFTNVVSNTAPLDHQGLVNGICQTGGQLGVAISIAIATSEVGNPLDIKSYHAAYYTLIAYSVLAFIIAVIFLKADRISVGVQRDQGVKVVDGEVQNHEKDIIDGAIETSEAILV